MTYKLVGCPRCNGSGKEAESPSAVLPREDPAPLSSLQPCDRCNGVGMTEVLVPASNGEAFRFSVDDKQYELSERSITGARIREIADIDKNLRIFLVKHRQENEASGHRTSDRAIHNSYTVDLANPGEEKFYTLLAPSMDIN